MKHVKQQNSRKTISEETQGKHDVNLRKNGALYFQIGLILCLLGAYAALEYNFTYKDFSVEEPLALQDDDVFFVTPVTVVNREIAKAEPQKSKPKLLVEPKIIEDDELDSQETDDFVKELTQDVPKDAKVEVDAGDLDIDKPIDIDPIPVAFVQNVPVYPGCESERNNKDRLKCMSSKLGKLVQKKFNTDIAADNGLTGKQRIFIQFKIGKNGEVSLVKTQAPHAALEKEASRLTSKIPSMKPGIQNDRAVEVLYTLPILFNVEN